MNIPFSKSVIDVTPTKISESVAVVPASVVAKLTITAFAPPATVAWVNIPAVAS